MFVLDYIDQLHTKWNALVGLNDTSSLAKRASIEAKVHPGTVEGWRRQLEES